MYRHGHHFTKAPTRLMIITLWKGLIIAIGRRRLVRLWKEHSEDRMRWPNLHEVCRYCVERRELFKVNNQTTCLAHLAAEVINASERSKDIRIELLA